MPMVYGLLINLVFFPFTTKYLIQAFGISGFVLNFISVWIFQDIYLYCYCCYFKPYHPETITGIQWRNLFDWNDISQFISLGNQYFFLVFKCERGGY